MVQPSSSPLSRAVDAWASQAAAYNFSAGRFTITTGHFTQLVWKSTTSIGFGWSDNGGYSFAVMWFYPPGNVLDQFAENVIAPAPTKPRPPLPPSPNRVG